MNLGVDPKDKRLVLIENGRTISNAESSKYRIDADSEIESAKKFIRQAFVEYVRAYPSEAREVNEACKARQEAAVNKYNASPGYSWRLSMIIPVALDIFIKKYVPNYLQNEKLRHWMMREFSGFAVPDKI